MTKDPVCGMTVSREDMAGESHYQGRAYYFCSPQCKERFDANPQPYVVPRETTPMVTED
jgi:YHS domain-containing protein